MTRPDNTSDGAQSSEKRGNTSNRSDDLKRRLDALDDALSERKQADIKAASSTSEADRKGYAQAFKLSSEFIAGIVAGAGIGYVLDTLVGTTPWGLMIFLLLGFAAGVLNVLRSVGAVAQPDERIK